MVLNTSWLITNTLRLKPWIVDDNDADRIVIGPDLIRSAYVRRYLQRISMETRKTWWCCQEKRRHKRMPSAERTSAAAANARAAETKEKVKRLFHPQSVDLWRHLKLLRFDKICVSKAEKETPDSQWWWYLSWYLEGRSRGAILLVSSFCCRSAVRGRLGRTIDGAQLMAPEISSQVATAALRGRCSGVARRSSTLDRTSLEQNGTFCSWRVVECSMGVLACVLRCHGNGTRWASVVSVGHLWKLVGIVRLLRFLVRVSRRFCPK